MNFELIDNTFQVAVLAITAFFALITALRNRDRFSLILSLSYASFSMGTLFFLLHLAIRGYTPTEFYVSEVSWLAGWLFCLSFQIARSEGLKIKFSPISMAGAILISGLIMIFQLFGPSRVVSFSFALTIGILTYLSLFRLRNHAGLPSDGAMLVFVLLQLTLYIVSYFITDYTKFNLYFAIDILLTFSFVSVLPLSLREGRKR